VEANLYTQWNRYGTYCFVPAEDDIIAILNALRKGNAKWQTYFFPCKNPGRPLDVCSYLPYNISSNCIQVMETPFDRPHWDVIVLHPHAMPPEGLVLPIFKDRFLYVEGKDFPPACKVTWTYWTASGDRLCSSYPPHEPLAPFLATDIRAVTRPFPPLLWLSMHIQNCSNSCGNMVHPLLLRCRGSHS
jgi:hypothetical protein